MVEFDLRRFGERTFVFVFMHTDALQEPEDILTILKSFKPRETL
jgi:hypothetical protein